MAQMIIDLNSNVSRENNGLGQDILVEHRIVDSMGHFVS